MRFFFLALLVFLAADPATAQAPDTPAGAIPGARGIGTQSHDFARSRTTTEASTLTWLGETFSPMPPQVVTDDGTVIGVNYYRDRSVVVFWTRLGGHVVVDSLELHGTVRGFSSDGTMLVGDWNQRSYRWTHSDGIVDLPPLYMDDFSTTALDVSDDGSVVVGRASGPRGSVPVRWTVGGGIETFDRIIDNFDGNPFSAYVWAVSGDGLVAVGHSDYMDYMDDIRTQAAIWHGTSISLLGTLHEDQNDPWSWALDVSFDGSVVTGVSGYYGADSTRAFRWTEAAGIVDLGTFGEESHDPHGISADGSVIVGTAGSASEAKIAFRWTLEGGLEDLNAVLSEALSDGSELRWASAVSPDGRFIVGQGWNASTARLESWLMHPCGTSFAWENPSGGNFSTPENWAGKNLPGRHGTALFDQEASYSVSIDENVENSSLEVRGAADLTLSMGSYTYTLSGECGTSSAVVESAFLELEEGTVEAAEAVLIYGNEPVLRVSDGARLTVGSDTNGRGCLIAEGDGGSEALIAVAGGGQIESRTCTLLGDVEETAGRLVVERGGSFVTDSLLAGGDGTAAVELSEGHLTARRLVLADGVGSTASVTAEGLGTLGFKESAYIGVRGRADLLLRNTSIAVGGDPDASAVSLLVLGREPGSVGRLILEDHSFFSNSDAVVGMDGLAALHLKSGGSAEIRRVWVGGHLEGTNGVGLVHVEGEGTQLDTRRIWVGRGLYGELKSTDGGLIRADRITIYGSGNTVDEAGGEIRAPILYVGSLPPPAPKHGASTTANKVASDLQGIVTDTLIIAGDGVRLEVDTLVYTPSGVIGGIGTFPSQLTNSGVLSPGDSAAAPGALAIAGSFTQTNTGILEIDIGGTGEGEYDVLAVTEEASLGGSLRLRLTGGYELHEGDVFHVVRAGRIIGAFENVEAPEDAGFEITYTDTSVMVVVTTGVGTERLAEEQPYVTVLLPNYPNPFETETLISIDLPKPAWVRLSVFDLNGREVARLVDEFRTAGRHTVVFRDADLASGIYLYRLKTDGFSETRRMVLVK